MSCKEYIDFEIRHGPRKGSHVKIKCGKCVLCRIDRRREWTQRLMWEWQSRNYSGHFVTLTYRDEFLGSNNLDYRDIQLFLKRLRKRTSGRIKFYAAGEYGEQTFRKHWHLVLFGNINRYDILKSWTFGGCDLKPINRNRLRYTLKYLDKEDWFDPKLFMKLHDKTPPCHHMSNGIGAAWLDAHKDELECGYIEVARRGGKKIIPVPRYYRDKYGFSAPPVHIDPVKEEQIKMFREGGIDYITAYGLVYGAYAASISNKCGVYDSLKNIQIFKRKKACIGQEAFFEDNFSKSERVTLDNILNEVDNVVNF